MSMKYDLSTGESCEVEDGRWPDGWPDHQWGAGDAPTSRLHPGLQARRLARDFCLWQRLQSARDTLSTAAGQDGEYSVPLMGNDVLPLLPTALAEEAEDSIFVFAGLSQVPFC